MTKEEALDVFKTIIAFYPNFNTKGSKEDKRTIASKWINKLMEADYNGTMKRLDKYSENSPFAPTIADILAYPPRKKYTKDYSEDIRKVQEEKMNPETAKLREEKLKKLKAAMGGVLGD